MVARFNNEMLSQALLTPRPEVSDSDQVLLALETARALEMQGEFREAARWLRRGAEEAEAQGNDERVLALARAAADLASALGSSPPAGDAITMPPPGAADAITMPPLSGVDAATTPPAAAGVTDRVDAPYPPTTPAPASFESTFSASASVPATSPPSSSASATVSSRPSDMPLTERSMRIGAMRVAIVEGAIRGEKSFSVERLDRGQLPPPGAIEAMLVFTGEGEDEQEEVDLLAASDSSRL